MAKNSAHKMAFLNVGKLKNRGIMVMLGKRLLNQNWRKFRKMPLFGATVAVLVALPPSQGQAQIPVENQLASIVQSVPLPFDTPLFTIDDLRAEGKTLHRTLRLKGNLQHLGAAELEIARRSQRREQTAAVCKGAMLRNLMRQGVIIQDVIQFVDRTEFLRVRIDAAACDQRPKYADFSGPDRISPTINDRIQELADRSPVPANLGVGTITGFTAKGRRLIRDIVMTYENTATELRHGGRETWIGVQCKEAILAQMILDGAIFEDRMRAPDGSEIAVIVTDRASCHRVLGNG